MAWMIFLTVLAAIGVLSILWAALGWLLPGGQGCALVCVGEPDVGTLSRWQWLKGLGLLRFPLIAVTDAEMPWQDTDMERCRPEELLSRLEMERNRFDGTGNGDPTGRHQRRGISEL